MARARTGPARALEYEIAGLIARVKLRTRWPEKQISVNLGYEENFIRDRKSRGTLGTIKAETLYALAEMAGCTIRIEEKERR